MRKLLTQLFRALHSVFDGGSFFFIQRDLLAGVVLLCYTFGKKRHSVLHPVPYCYPGRDSPSDGAILE